MSEVEWVVFEDENIEAAREFLKKIRMGPKRAHLMYITLPKGKVSVDDASKLQVLQTVQIVVQELINRMDC